MIEWTKVSLGIWRKLRPLQNTNKSCPPTFYVVHAVSIGRLSVTATKNLPGQLHISSKTAEKDRIMTTLTGPKHYHVQNGGAKWNTNMTSVDSANQLCVRRKQLHLAVYVASDYSKFESDQRTHKITSGNRSVKCRFKIIFQI